MAYKTDQENFWAGQFGNDYIARNSSEFVLSKKIAHWTRILNHTGGGWNL